VAEEGLADEVSGLEARLGNQRLRARGGAEIPRPAHHEAVIAFASAAPASTFVGYETLHAETAVIAAEELAGNGKRAAVLAKLEESPFYPEGGGQVSDSGVIRWDGQGARVADVYRVGDDQVIRVDGPVRAPGTRVEAEG